MFKKLAGMKKLILFFGVICFSCALFAERPLIRCTTGNLKWILSDNGTLIISGQGNMPNYDTPDKEAPWYKYGKYAIRTVLINKGITSIGDFAFKDCSYLKSVIISGSVTSIGDHAFDDCTGLTSVTIPKGVISIGNYAFSGCKSLTSVIISNSVTNIGKNPFSSCINLESIYVASDNQSYISIDDVLFDKKLTRIICYAGGKEGVYAIPSSVTSIGDEAFMKCTGLTSIFIPNSITSISFNAFYGCVSLTSITIPDSVTSIGDGAFGGCTGLTSVVIPNSVTHIGYNTFSNCSGLTSITIPNSVTQIEPPAFNKCKNLKSFHVASDNPVYIDIDGIIFSRDLTKIILFPAGRKGAYTIPSSVTSIGYRAFCNCSNLTSVVIPNSVTNICYGAFSDCSGLTSITIPGSVTSIEDYAFSGCFSLTSIDIPKSVTSLGKIFYTTLPELSNITVNWESPIKINDNALMGVLLSTTLHVPFGTKSLYQRAEGWHKFNIVEQSE